MKNPPMPRSRGFTLIELLIASTVALVVFSAALGAGISLQKVNGDQQDMMTLQTSLRFSEDIFVRELEKAGAGMARIAIFGFDQVNANNSRARLAITIEDIAAGADAACTSDNCSRITIYSGDVQNSLQVKKIESNQITTVGSTQQVAFWTQANNAVSHFFIVNHRAGAQCLFENVPTGNYAIQNGGRELVVEIATTTATIDGNTQTCQLDTFDDAGRAFIIPMRAALFMTNGFKVNDPLPEPQVNTFLAPDAAQPRFQYIPNQYDRAFIGDKNALRWHTLSREMEALGIRYTIFNNADPTQARWRINAGKDQKERAELVRFDPTGMTNQAAIDAIVNDNDLLPTSDATAATLMAMFKDQPEAFTIPLLRRISQIDVDMLVRRPCREEDPTRCTRVGKDLDQDYAYQVRTVSTRINPHNLALIAINEFIR